MWKTHRTFWKKATFNNPVSTYVGLKKLINTYLFKDTDYLLIWRLKKVQDREDKQRNKNNGEPKISTAPIPPIPRLHLKLTNQIVWMIKTKTNKKARQRLCENMMVQLNSQEFPHLFLGVY